MTPPAINHRKVARSLCNWFLSSKRDLPWRRIGECTRRNPYHTLVSEFMLQQTQVSRVLEYFEPFIERFPTVSVLARAREQSVLGMWSGLGYYRRAKNLHAAARAIQRDLDGCVPSDPAALLALPGVGRYTAGAIASLAFDEPEPIVDGNVSRVLQRLHGRRETAADASAWTWEQAISLVTAAARVGLSAGDTNEALMELGATVCTPKGPKCAKCPLERGCIAQKQGEQEDIPLPKRTATRRPLYCASVVLTDTRGHVLLEKRAATGMWADMWQTPTLERDDRPPTAAQLLDHCNLAADSDATIKRVGTFEHQTTHRVVHFSVYAGSTAEPAAELGRTTKSDRSLSSLALSNAQRKVIALAGVKPG